MSQPTSHQRFHPSAERQTPTASPQLTNPSYVSKLFETAGFSSPWEERMRPVEPRSCFMRWTRVYLDLRLTCLRRTDTWRRYICKSESRCESTGRERSQRGLRFGDTAIWETMFRRGFERDHGQEAVQLDSMVWSELRMNFNHRAHSVVLWKHRACLGAAN